MLQRTLTRNGLTRRAMLSAATILAAPPAWALQTSAQISGQFGLSFPLRIGYARIGPQGFMRLGADEQLRWSAMELHLGGLIARMVPLQSSSMFGAPAPQVDGGAACALVARQMAADAGLGHALLYAVDDDAKTEGGWIAQCFAAVRAAGGAGRISGEAHLLDIAGGAPVESAFADAPRRGFLGAVAGRPKAAATTLDLLSAEMERRIQRSAAAAFDAGYSIADGFMRSPR